MMLLDRAAILNAQDIKHEDVPVPEWGGTVRVRALSGTERDAYYAGLVGTDGKVSREQQTAKFMALCIIGEDGKRLFGEDDIAALGGKSALALARVSKAADRLNVISEETIKAAEKNSERGPSDSSS